MHAAGYGAPPGRLRPGFFAGFHRCLPALAAAGNDLIVEHVIEFPAWRADLAELLDGLDVCSSSPCTATRPSSTALRGFSGGSLEDLPAMPADVIKLHDRPAGHGRDHQWHLREVMAARGLFTTTGLVPRLADRGITLSASQVHRLVTGIPGRLSLPVLAALCDIRHVTPDDLITVTAGPASARKTSAARVTIMDLTRAQGADLPASPEADRPGSALSCRS